MTRALLTILVLAAPAAADGPGELIRGDLSNWAAVAKPPGDPSQTWSIDNGILKCSGKPTGYLVTKSEYANYTLTLEFRYPPNSAKRSNSGLLIHCQKDDVFWPHSYEVQLAQGQIGDIWFQPDANKRLPKLTIPAAQLDAKNPTRHYFRLGGVAEKPYPAWNRIRVEAVGDTLVVRVNDRVANRATGSSLTKGRIGLQAEGVAAEFRKIEMTQRSAPE